MYFLDEISECKINWIMEPSIGVKKYEQKSSIVYCQQYCK